MILYTKRLERAGFNREQAEVQVDVLMEMIVDGVSTKKDLEIHAALMAKEFVMVRAEMAAGFTAVRFEMETGSAAVRSEVSSRLASLEQRLLVRMGSMFIASTAIMISALAIILK